MVAASALLTAFIPAAAHAAPASKAHTTAAAVHAAPASKSRAAQAAHTTAAQRTLQSSFASTVAKGAKSGREVIVGHSVKNDVSRKLRNMKAKPAKAWPRRAIPVLPLVHPHPTR